MLTNFCSVGVQPAPPLFAAQGEVWHVPDVPSLPSVQLAGAVQLPQLMVPPQPSDCVPQFAPPEQVVAGTQLLTQVPDVEVTVSWQAVPEGQVGPQLIVPPQPSGSLPQVAPAVQVVFGVHWHVPEVPPDELMTQVCGAVQAGPQLIVPPQPSDCVPQVSLPRQAVRGTQEHVPAALQVCPLGQPGVHVMVPPQPSGAVPQTWPIGHEVAGTQTHAPLVQVLPEGSCRTGGFRRSRPVRSRR